MGLSFGFPPALWGLLGLPVIVLIHFLQSRERKEVVSTLFLLELLPEETRRGAVFTRLRTGLQLWLQLLAVLLLTLLLSRPMWLRKESVQTVAIVVDVSASMRAFREGMVERLEPLLNEIEQTAGTTEWILLPSDLTRPQVYKGPDLEGLFLALDELDYRSGPHSARPMLGQARRLVGEEGALIWVTDHPEVSAPADVQVLGVGSPLDNTGVSGLNFTRAANGEWAWEASLVHFSNSAETKTVAVFADGEPVATVPAQVQPGGLARISGQLPADTQRGRLRLEDDALDVDNELPFVMPVQKTVLWDNRLDGPAREWADKVMQTVTPTEASVSDAILAWRKSGIAAPPPLHPFEILVLDGDNEADFTQTVSMDHPLLRDLSWSGFLARPLRRAPYATNEDVLVWMGEFPLISLLENEGQVQLLLNFSWERSNADRFPSMILLLNRFVRGIQDGLPGEDAANVEVRQRLEGIEMEGPITSRFESLTGDVNEQTLDRYPEQAPDSPGYWTLLSGEEVLFRAGVYSGDVQEGDLRKASSTVLTEAWVSGRRDVNSEQDVLRSLWFALLGMVLVGAWWAGRQHAGRSV
jgi:hypothetical protein